MSDLPSVTLVKKHFSGEYYDYIGRVEVRPNKFLKGSNYVVIVDRKTGETLCEIDGKHKEKFLKYEGQVIGFRGIVHTRRGRVTPHIKQTFKS